MPRRIADIINVATFLILASVAAAAPATQHRPQRRFRFVYRSAVTALRQGQTARVWIPVPPSNDDQQAERVGDELPPGWRLSTDASGDNRLIYFEASAGADGRIPFAVTYDITRYEVSESPANAGDSDSRYLAADALVPVGGKPAALFLAGRTLPADPLQAGRELFDLVDGHMEYRKDKPGWGRGDAEWACDSRFGNCTDFHSLFISLARTERMPARFEIGFTVPPEPPAGAVAGYHCWAKFKPQGHGWVPVDISEASKNPGRRDYYFGHLSTDRVCFSTGRDLRLTPRQSGPPVNFLVFPYVEVDGAPLAQQQVQNDFRYKNLGPAQAVPAVADTAPTLSARSSPQHQRSITSLTTLVLAAICVLVAVGAILYRFLFERPAKATKKEKR